MATQNLRASVIANVYEPTAAGRVQSGKHGFVRMLDFSDIRQKTPGGPAPDESPEIELVPMFMEQTSIATSVNGLTLERRMVPRDMTFDDWTGSGQMQEAVKEVWVVEPLMRKWFYISRVSQQTGQNYSLRSAGGPGYVQGSIPSENPPPESAFSSGTAPNPVFSFLSNFTLESGEGWAIEERRFGIASAQMSPIWNILDGFFGLLARTILLDTESANLLNPVYSYSTVQWGIPNALQWMFLIAHEIALPVCYLLKSTNGGETWKIVDHQPHTPGAYTFTQRGETRIANFRVESGNAVFEIMPGSVRWVFRDPDDPVNGFVSPAGRVAVNWYGTAGVFILNKIGYPNLIPGSNIIGRAKSRMLFLPPWVNSDPSALSFKLYPRDDQGNDVSGTQAVTTSANAIPNPDDSSQYQLELVMTSTGAGALQAPVVLGAQEIRQPAVEVIATAHGDLGADLLEISWKQNRGHRGGEATLKVKNENGQWSFLNVNELVKISVKMTTGTDGAGPFDSGTTSTSDAVSQFVGQIVSNKYVEDAEKFPNTPGYLEIQLRGLDERLAKKKMQYMGPFGGWGLAEAASYILNRCGFHPDSPGAFSGDYYDFTPDSTRNTGVDPTFTLKSTATVQGKGHHSFVYSDQDNATTALDEMFQSWGMEWGEYPDGVIRAWSINSYDPSYSYTLDDTNFDPDTDLIEAVNVERTLHDYWNTEIVHAKDKNGVDQVGQYSQYNDIYGNYGDPNFVGDDLWDTFHAPDGADPSAVAMARLAVYSGYGTVIKWTTDLDLNLAPRHRVIVNLNLDSAGLGIAPGTPFVVLDRAPRIEPNGDQPWGRSEYTLGVPTLPSGGKGQ